jgi:hypothetical protein
MVPCNYELDRIEENGHISKAINGESHDQADAEWKVIRTQLRGPLGGQPPADPPAARGLATLWVYFVCFSYY